MRCASGVYGAELRAESCAPSCAPSDGPALECCEQERIAHIAQELHADRERMKTVMQMRRSTLRETTYT